MVHQAGRSAAPWAEAGQSVRQLAAEAGLPRTRSVNQEQMGSSDGPARSPDAPPDPAARDHGHGTVSNPQQKVQHTLHNASGTARDVLSGGGPDAAEKLGSSRQPKQVYQQQPSPESGDADVRSMGQGQSGQAPRDGKKANSTASGAPLQSGPADRDSPFQVAGSGSSGSGLGDGPK